MTKISDEELVRTIGEFIELGHVENIVAMFKQDPGYYRFTGDLLRDERFVVRMGMVLLFEELVAIRPDEVSLAVPTLLPLLTEEAYIRGEAVTLLGIIATREALDGPGWPWNLSVMTRNPRLLKSLTIFWKRSGLWWKANK